MRGGGGTSRALVSLLLQLHSMSPIEELDMSLHCSCEISPAGRWEDCKQLCVCVCVCACVCVCVCVCVRVCERA